MHRPMSSSSQNYGWLQCRPVVEFLRRPRNTFIEGRSAANYCREGEYWEVSIWHLHDLRLHLMGCSGPLPLELVVPVLSGCQNLTEYTHSNWTFHNSQPINFLCQRVFCVYKTFFSLTRLISIVGSLCLSYCIISSHFSSAHWPASTCSTIKSQTQRH